MRKAQLAQDLDLVVTPNTDTAGRPLTDAIERQNRSLLKRRRKERTRGVRFVMLEKDIAALVTSPETTVDLSRRVELLSQPER